MCVSFALDYDLEGSETLKPQSVQGFRPGPDTEGPALKRSLAGRFANIRDPGIRR